MDDLALMLPTPAEPPNGEYVVHERGITGKQLVASYTNGYGASVISGPYSYGGPEGLFELAVFHEGELCYRTPITEDVRGWLTAEQVVIDLHAIANLARNDDCDHSDRAARKGIFAPDYFDKEVTR